MKWSFRIATIAGTEVRIHATFFLLLTWVGMSFLLFGGALAAAVGIAFICALFLCVLLHEFGHVLAAKHFGIPTPDITLLPIGGLARMKTMPKRPYQELIIALAGPAVNVVIGLALLTIVGRPSFEFGTELNLSNPRSILPQLAVVNLWLAAFNLIPAFPMDGGRVLRAALASFMDHTRATSIAARVGQALAIVGGMIGFAIGHPILILVAIFIYFGATQESVASIMHEALDGIPVRDAMLTEILVLKSNSTISDATKALLAGSQQHFPVVDRNGGLLGIATRDRIIAGLAEHGMSHPIAEVMERCSEAVSAEASAIDAIDVLHHSESPVLPVIDSRDHHLVGMLTTENIAEMMMVKSAVNRLSSRRQATRNKSHMKDGKDFDSSAVRMKEVVP